MLALEKMKCASERSVLAEKWEPLLNNLGHVCRKLRYLYSVYSRHAVYIMYIDVMLYYEMVLSGEPM